MDHIWLQSKLRWGPNMIAILITNGTKYDCNDNHNGDHIWLQSVPIKTKKTAIMFTWLKHEFRDCNHIWSLMERIAIIYGVNCDNCIHIWFSLWSRLQSYLVPRITIDAAIFGPLHKNYCNHIWSSPIFDPKFWPKYTRPK